MKLFKCKVALLILSCIPFLGIAQNGLQSPSSYLGYTIGTKFTRHHQVVAYFNSVAQANPSMVKIISYGKTNEGRDLLVAAVGLDLF